MDIDVFTYAIIFFQYINAASEDITAIRPTGIKMCERLCQQTVGCIRFGYSHQQLACYIQPDKESLKTIDGTIRFYNLTKAAPMSEDACPLTSRKLYSKRHFEICRSSQTQLPNHQMTKLLIARSRPGKVKQVSLINNMLTTYLERFQGVSAIAYVPASKKLVFYILDTMSLMMASMNGSDAITITNDCHYLIAVAEDKIFFISSPMTNGELMQASPYGKDIQAIRKFKDFPQSMAVDMKQRFLYVEVMYVTNVYNYRGEKQYQLEASNVYIEPYGDYLFLSDKGWTQYFRMPLEGANNTKTAFASLDAKDGKPCIYQNTLYILSPETCDVKVVYRNQSHLIKVFKGERYMSCYCCLLP